ncbi:MAG: hypothetical protein IKT11_05780, partial [Bacteroidales bacterium]|nr:hypothetical protein [Bacteroidales bacterium]
AVLVECGFISNAGDLEVFRSDTGKNSIAEGLFKAFVAFKNKYDNSLKSGGDIPVEARREEPKREDIKPAAPEVKPVAVEEEAPVSGVYYGTQILASGRRRPANDSFFKGHKPKIIWTGRLYKYVVGVSDSLSEARKKNDELQKFFPDSFVVKVDGENVEIVK